VGAAPLGFTRVGRQALIDDDSPTPASQRDGRDEGPDASPVAVALDNDQSGRQAPRVIAKGRGAIAEQILQIAFDRGVRVRTDADLAEILAAVELDSEIPLEALAAVAEILSYVYRAQQEAPAQSGKEQ
jgi:flagellar biosynthesis protein